MSDLIPANFGAVSSKFAVNKPEDDLSSGIQSSFGLVGYKGKVWSIRYRGDEKQLMRDDGDGPRGSIEVVILKSSKNISKIWYEAGYVEGSNAAPDCFSNNGIAPEATSAKPQCASCAICPHNQWGSRVTPAGKSGKSCSDSKRLAVAPLADLNNDAYGGPMLLRVPAASLQDVASYGQKMQQMGYPYYAIGTKIAFDPEESYPKFIFSGLRPLTDQEADIVLGLRDSHSVERILSENEFAPASVPAGSPANDKPLFEQAPDVGAKALASPAPASNAAVDAAAAERDELQRKIAELQAQAAAAEAAKANTPPAKTDLEVLQELQAQEAANKAKAAADAKAKQEREAAELAAKVAAEEAARKAAEEATAKAAAAAAAQSAEDPDAALKRQIAELQAKLNAAPADPAPTPAPEVKAETKVTETVAADTQNVASGFEADLDSMLADLLP